MYGFVDYVVGFFFVMFPSMGLCCCLSFLTDFWLCAAALLMFGNSCLGSLFPPAA